MNNYENESGKKYTQDPSLMINNNLKVSKVGDDPTHVLTRSDTFSGRFGAEAELGPPLPRPPAASGYRYLIFAK